ARPPPIAPNPPPPAAPLPPFSASPFGSGVRPPPGPPPAVIEKLSAAARATLKSEDVGGKLAGPGFEPLDGSPEEFAQLIAHGMATWAAAAEAAGLRK